MPIETQIDFLRIYVKISPTEIVISSCMETQIESRKFNQNQL
jgi:hypothetical protein